MHDTKLTPRQQLLLQVIERSPSGLTRTEVERVAHSSSISISKATLLRDLSSLVNQGLVTTSGSGRSTRYLLAIQHAYLRFLDLDEYFAQEVDERPVMADPHDTAFISELPGLLSPQEVKTLDTLNRQFQENVQLLDPSLYKKELDRFVIELSWKSSRIEGNTYTLLDTERLLQDNQEAAGHPREEAIMILNHKRAFETIFAHKETFKSLRSSDILEIHRVLVADLNISEEIRRQPVGITGTNYKPPSTEWQTKEALELLVSVANKVPQPVEKALIVSALLAYIQPFVDGNKRTSRLVANALLLAHGYAPLSYRSVDELEYKQALIVFYETHNLYHFKRLFVEQFKFSVETYFSLHRATS